MTMKLLNLADSRIPISNNTVITATINMAGRLITPVR